MRQFNKKNAFLVFVSNKNRDKYTSILKVASILEGSVFSRLFRGHKPVLCRKQMEKNSLSITYFKILFLGKCWVLAKRSIPLRNDRFHGLDLFATFCLCLALLDTNGDCYFLFSSMFRNIRHFQHLYNKA